MKGWVHGLVLALLNPSLFSSSFSSLPFVPSPSTDMLSLPTLVSLLLLAVPNAVLATPCVSFDADFNLLAFGFDGKDWNAGQQDSWTSGE